MSEFCMQGEVCSCRRRLCSSASKWVCMDPMGTSIGLEETEQTSGNAAAHLWDECVKPPAAFAITALIFLFREVVKCC